MGSPALRRERLATRWARRALTIPLILVGAAVVLPLLPALLVLTLGLDAVRRSRLSLSRALVFVGVYFVWELWGLVSLLALTPLIVSKDLFLRANARLQAMWGASIYRAFEIVYGLRTRVHGQVPTAGRGPLLVFFRHASSADTMLPFWLLGSPHGYRLRYVLKAELLYDPCIDLSCQRLPNCFVRRRSGDAAAEVARITALLEGMTPSDALIIYPEGTRFTPERRARALARLEAEGEALSLARSLTNTLSPLRAGPLALLAQNKGADLVVVGHTGLEPAGSFEDLVRGGLVGNAVEVCITTVPASELPADPEGQAALLARLWIEVDRFIAREGSSQGSRDAPR